MTPSDSPTGAPTLREALEACQELFEKALPKFNWGASFLDATAIRLLNEVPGKVSAALSAQAPPARDQDFYDWWWAQYDRDEWSKQEAAFETWKHFAGTPQAAIGAPPQQITSVAQRPEASKGSAPTPAGATAAPQERQVSNLRQSSDSSPEAACVLASAPEAMTANPAGHPAQAVASKPEAADEGLLLDEIVTIVHDDLLEKGDRLQRIDSRIWAYRRKP